MCGFREKFVVGFTVNLSKMWRQKRINLLQNFDKSGLAECLCDKDAKVLGIQIREGWVATVKRLYSVYTVMPVIFMSYIVT